MLKKLIAYQRLLLNSTPPINIISQNPLKSFLTFVAISVMIFMNMYIFMGTVLFESTTLVIILPIVSIWMINRILYGDHTLYDIVPVKRQYTLLSVFLLAIVISFMGYFAFIVTIVVLIWGLIGVVYVTSPQSITSPSPSSIQNIVDTTKGDILILCIFVIIIFSGVAITFIKSKKLRLSSFAGFAVIGYGLLFLLKINMPISPITGKIEFLESFSIMPQAITILICVAIATVIISITSVFMGVKLYVGKSIHENNNNFKS